jgi:hypothetical protein
MRATGVGGPRPAEDLRCWLAARSRVSCIWPGWPADRVDMRETMETQGCAKASC